METADSYQISGDWTDLNALSGIDIGQQITLHNAGRAGDIIEVAVSAIEPSVSLRGVAIKALEPQYRIGPQEVAIWVRYIRYDLNGTITPQPQHKCLLNVQSISDIEEVGSIPSSLLTTNNSLMRLKVSAAELVPEVSKGNVPGHSMLYIHGYANGIGTDEALVWPLNRPIVFNDTPSNLYLSSTDNTDTQPVLVQWLDDQYNKQQTVVQLTGQTPTLIGLGLRVNNMFTASTPGTLGDVYASNENNHAGGIPVNLDSVIAFYEAKTQTSSGLHYTVPVGHTVFGLSGYFSASKGKDYDFYWNIRNPTAGLPDINTNVLSVYESTIEVNFQYTSIPEKTDAYFTAATSGAAGRASVRIPAMLVDNNFL